jgi:hypothetical protein
MQGGSLHPGQAIVEVNLSEYAVGFCSTAQFLRQVAR